MVVVHGHLDGRRHAVHVYVPVGDVLHKPSAAPLTLDPDAHVGALHLDSLKEYVSHSAAHLAADCDAVGVIHLDITKGDVFRDLAMCVSQPKFQKKELVGSG